MVWVELMSMKRWKDQMMPRQLPVQEGVPVLFQFRSEDPFPPNFQPVILNAAKP